MRAGVRRLKGDRELKIWDRDLFQLQVRAREHVDEVIAAQLDHDLGTLGQYEMFLVDAIVARPKNLIGATVGESPCSAMATCFDQQRSMNDRGRGSLIAKVGGGGSDAENRYQDAKSGSTSHDV